MTAVHDLPFVAGIRSTGSTFGCPSLLPAARCSSCDGTVFEVILRMYTTVISGLLQPLTKSLYLSLQHYHYH